MIEQTTNKMKNINNWIKQNPQVTEPNFYEITDCFIETAKLAAIYKDTSKENEEAMKGCYAQLQEMLQLRNVSQHPFIVETDPARCMLEELNQLILNGTYHKPDDASIEQIQDELIKKCMSVSFYIHSTKKNEPNYQYDNREEFSSMNDMYTLYTEYYQSKNLTGPCSKFIKPLLDTIDKDYKYSEQRSINKTM